MVGHGDEARLIHINALCEKRRMLRDMSFIYQIDALGDEEISLALPLIQVTWPVVDLPLWRKFVKESRFDECSAQSGILVLRDTDHYLTGLLAYRVEHDLLHGAVLSVPLLTVVDLGNALPVVRAMVDAAELRATILGCDHLRITIHPEQAGLGTRLRRIGMVAEGRQFHRPVAQETARH